MSDSAKASEEAKKVVEDLHTKSDYYLDIARSAETRDIDTVKRVLHAAREYAGPPATLLGQLTSKECEFLQYVLTQEDMDPRIRSDKQFLDLDSAEVLRMKLDAGSRNGLIPEFFYMVERFNREVVGLPIPVEPTMLSVNRVKYAIEHLEEELQEFIEATEHGGDLDRATDAIIDLVYVALGRLVEMGIAPGPVFEEVHAANMRKRRGTVSKRPNSAGHDAVKPEGWKPPDLVPYLTLTGEQLRDIAKYQEGKRSWEINGSTTIRNGAEFERHANRRWPWLEHLSPVLLELTELRRTKGQDYNVGGPEIRDYFPFGHTSYAQMLHVKNLRVRALLAVRDAGRTLNHEGLRDTLLDLLNYTVFYLEAIDRGDLDPEEAG